MVRADWNANCRGSRIPRYYQRDEGLDGEIEIENEGESSPVSSRSKTVKSGIDFADIRSLLTSFPG
jgi:hypothetical protein